MAEELLSLKWNNHQSHFVDILSYLREQEIFIDATIACGGKVYSAHKFVLSTCSEYFKQIFAVNKSTHPIVFMKDVSCKDIEALLDFMYHGEVNVPQSNLGSLIKTAEGLQIKGLAVPDDPPTNKRDRESTNTGSPPAKKLHTDRSPARNRMSGQTNFNVNSRNNNRPPSPDINSSRPEKDKTQINSRSTNSSSIINQSSSNINKGSSISNRHSKEEVDPVDDERGETEPQSQMTSNEEPENDDDAEDPGPVVNAATKQEEMEIKQEEVVDLDDEDPDPTDDWLGPHNNDNSLGSDNNSSSMFPVDLLMHGADNGMGAGTSSGNSNAAGNVAGTSSASDAAMDPLTITQDNEDDMDDDFVGFPNDSSSFHTNRLSILRSSYQTTLINPQQTVRFKRMKTSSKSCVFRSTFCPVENRTDRSFFKTTFLPRMPTPQNTETSVPMWPSQLTSRAIKPIRMRGPTDHRSTVILNSGRQFPPTVNVTMPSDSRMNYRKPDNPTHFIVSNSGKSLTPVILIRPPVTSVPSSYRLIFPKSAIMPQAPRPLQIMSSSVAVASKTRLPLVIHTSEPRVTSARVASCVTLPTANNTSEPPFIGPN